MKRPVLFLFVGISAVYSVFYLYKFQTLDLTEIQATYDEYESLLKVDSGKCSFHADPYDPRILQYIEPPHEPVVCVPKQENLTIIKNQRLILLDNSTSDCEYRYFYHNSGVDDFTVKYGDWKPLKSEGVQLENDFVDVRCTGTFGIESYRYQHATIVPKNVTTESGKQILEESEENPSVIMIGFDAVSRSNFIRQFKETKKQMDEMGFVLMDKHIKVGDNTFPNWMAMLLGQHAIDYQFKPTLDSRTGISYDNWTEIIWRKYGAAGYATLFAEDSPDIATFNFNGLHKGFIQQQPADHYLRLLYLAWKDHKLRDRSSVYCYDSEPVHKIQFNYLEKFLDSYEKKAKFAWSWLVEVSHDYLNTVGMVDKDLQQFLKKNKKKLENSFVLIFSDHGLRYSGIRKTIVGRLESRLPILAIKPPKWLKTKNPKLFQTLKVNSQKMTNHFDTFATLRHILNGLQKIPPKLERGISFLEEIPENRTCLEAEIPNVFCPCFKEISLPTSEGVEYAKLLVDSIGNYFSKQKVQDKCAPMELDSVISVLLSMPPSKIAIDEKLPSLKALNFNYRIQFKVKSPSNALLEGLVTKDKKTGEIFLSADFDRNDKYGNTSHCVEDQLLRKLCHCLN